MGEHYNIYYVAEASFFAIDCEKHSGLHVPEDCFIVEAVDEDSGQPVAPGKEGRLVITNLAVEATPYIRYRTHEVANCQTGNVLPDYHYSPLVLKTRRNGVPVKPKA